MQNAEGRTQNKKKRSPRLRILFGLLPAAFCLLFLPGCQILGIVAQAVPKYVAAQYDGLQGQDVAVMVWADRAVTIDWPTVEMDLGTTLLKKLQAAQSEDNPGDLKGTTFPVTPQSIARFQLEHPDAEMQPIADVAKQVGVHRLIYIEVQSLQTRPDSAVTADLFRGKIVADVRVIELDNGQAKVGFVSNNVTSKFPDKVPEEGVLNIGDAKTYVGTVDAFSSDLALKFYKHEEDRQPGE